MTKHYFAVCAYRESPYLEACLSSLKMQKGRCNVIVCTSTPNEHIMGLCVKYGFPLYVREGEPSLRDDWNFAAETAEALGASLLTIAHQDDRYAPEYSERVTKYFEFGAINMVVTRCDNIDEHGRKFTGKAERVKRFLRWPLSVWALSSTMWGKMHALKYGNAIPCPGVTYNLDLLELPIFDNDYRFVIDWEAFRKIAELPGQIVACEEPLVEIRLHKDSETVNTMNNDLRYKEELEMFKSFHSEGVAKFIARFYKGAGKNYGR
ncbi:MAG: glycosyltransferase family 2 protein [Eubacteriales bacterium]|nr:glycosyltransferase family 2 protein [Eubacteriales bacterium]